MTIVAIIVWTLLAAISSRDPGRDPDYPPLCCDSSLFPESDLRRLASIPDDSIDIGYWALVIAQECDSSVDISRYLSLLDSMAARIRIMVGPRKGDLLSLAMTKLYLYESGVWNGEEAFEYDFDDPFGEAKNARLLSHYLDSKQGNCVTMPTLMIALMERVDPEVYFRGVRAPRHIFCRLRTRNDSDVWNIEATNGGNAMRDSWLVQNLEIPKSAIVNGTYMRDLTKREYVAELLGELVAHLRDAKRWEIALAYTNLMLKLNHKSVSAMVYKGSLLAWMGQALQESLLHEERVISTETLDSLSVLRQESQRWIDSARSLGWESQTQKSRENYLRIVGNARSKRLEKED